MWAKAKRVFYASYLARVFEFIKDFFSYSRILAIFYIEHDENILRRSWFFKFCDNFWARFPKIIKSPEGTRSRLHNSIILNVLFSLSESLIISGHFFKSVLAAVPILGLLLVIFISPLAPPLSAILIGVCAFIFALFKYEIKTTATDAALIVFLIFLLIVSVSSPISRSAPITAFLFFGSALGYFLARACLITRQRAILGAGAFALSVVPPIILGFYQYATGTLGDSSWVDANLFGSLSRVFSSFQNPNLFGAYLVLIIPLILACVIAAKQRKTRILMGVILGAAFIALALTYSRGAYLAIVATLGIFFLIINWRSLFLFLPAGVLIYALLPSGIIGRLTSTTNLSDTSTITRISIWSSSARMALENGTWGIGMGTNAFIKIFPYYTQDVARAYHAHNLFLQILIESGLPALIAFLVFLIAFFNGQIVFMKRATSIRLRTLSAGFTCGALGFLITGLFDYVFFGEKTAFVFFIYLGAASAITLVNPLNLKRKESVSSVIDRLINKAKNA